MSKSQTPRKLARPELPREFAGNLAQFQSFLEAARCTEEEAPRRFEAVAPESDQYTEEETIARREAMLKRMLSTPPQHRTAKGEKANPPKKRGRPKKGGDSAVS